MKDVFICHAHEDKEQIVYPLIAALDNVNISYWLDDIEIKWGDSLTERINLGLSSSRYVIVILSECFLSKSWPQKEFLSVLNIEASTGETKVLPLLAAPKDSLASIFERFPFLQDKAFLTWNGNVDQIAKKLKTLVQVEPAKDGSPSITYENWEYFRQIPSHLRHAFSEVISEKTSEFVGRALVFSTIDNFIKNSSNGYFIIKGAPGIGKSAIISSLVKERGYPHHFNIALQGIVAFEYFVESLYYQLKDQLKLNISLSENFERDGGFLNDLLHEAGNAATKENPVVIVIDALDEADTTHLPSRANILFLPQNLPSNVFFIVTTRAKYDYRLHVSEAEEYVIAHNSKENMADIKDYISQKLTRQLHTRIQEWGISETDFSGSLSEKSEGNFMYLRHVLPAIEKGVFRHGSLDELPHGLMNYYRNHWRQMRVSDQEQFDRLYQPVICVLAAVREPVSVEQISKYTDQSYHKILIVIREWMEFLHVKIDTEPEYRIYHTSFQDYLKEEVDPGLRTYHAMIARYYLKLSGLQ